MDTKTEQSVCVYDVTSKATKKHFYHAFWLSL